MDIGRITSLPEPLDFSRDGQDNFAFSLLVTAAQARQLIGYGSAGSDRFVPVVFGSSWGSEHDGIYEVVDVGVEADPDLQAAGLRSVSVSLRAQNRGRAVANPLLLVRGDNRNRVGDVGVTGPVYRAAVPGGASTITSYNLGPGGFVVEAADVETVRGPVRRIGDGTNVFDSVARATTGPITLSGVVSVDGANAPNGQRILVKNQATASANGIYIVNTGGAWTRATDMAASDTASKALVYVVLGTANGGSYWMLPDRVLVNTTAQAWQRSPLWGLRESPNGGPVSLSYALPLANWYNGACTITQDGNLVTGNTLAGSGAVKIDNGLIRCGFTAAGIEIETASGSPLAYQDPQPVFFLMDSTVSPSIISNTAEQVVIRNRLSSTLYPSYRGVMDLAIMRGSRTATVSITFQTEGIIFVSVPDSEALAPASGIGYTLAVDSHLIYQTDNDAAGNRVGVSSALRQAVYVGIPEELPGGIGTFDNVRSASFGVHAVVGGGDTLTGIDKLYEMDRAWMAMLGQQTSAGVL